MTKEFCIMSLALAEAIVKKRSVSFITLSDGTPTFTWLSNLEMYYGV